MVPSTPDIENFIRASMYWIEQSSSPVLRSCPELLLLTSYASFLLNTPRETVEAPLSRDVTGARSVLHKLDILDTLQHDTEVGV